MGIGDGASEPTRGGQFVPSPPRRPKLSPAGLILQLWRAKWLMLLVFLPLFALGLLAAFSLPRTYTATTRLLVSLSDEYVYRPSVGTDSAPVSPELEALVQSEIELLRSPVVARNALAALSIARAYPDIAKACTQSECERQAMAALMADLSVASAPKNPVIVARFAHQDPVLAAETLNAVTAAFITYRAGIFADGRASNFKSQRENFERDLAATDAEIRTYLIENGLTNLDAERQTLRELYQTASNLLLQTESRIRQVEGEAASYRRQIAGIEPQQDIYVEDTSEQSLIALRLEREEKLSRYKPDSRVIREIDKRIAQAEAYLASRPDVGGTVRRGPNPLYQQIETSLASLAAEAQSLRDQQVELRKQIADFETRQRRLTEVEPGLQELIRRRDVAEQSVRAFAEREVEARARAELSQQSMNTIRLLEPATAPFEGESLKLPVAVLALLFAGLTALFAGLLRALTRPGFATPASIERTLGLPVVAKVRAH